MKLKLYDAILCLIINKVSLSRNSCCISWRKHSEVKFVVFRKVCKQILQVLFFSISDLINIQKTVSGTAREKTKCAINRVLIGKVFLELFCLTL